MNFVFHEYYNHSMIEIRLVTVKSSADFDAFARNLKAYKRIWYAKIYKIYKITVSIFH